MGVPQRVEPAMLQHVSGAMLVQTAFQPLSQLFMKRMSIACARGARRGRVERCILLVASMDG
jgi:hypothetical protein